MKNTITPNLVNALALMTADPNVNFVNVTVSVGSSSYVYVADPILGLKKDDHVVLARVADGADVKKAQYSVGKVTEVKDYLDIEALDDKELRFVISKAGGDSFVAFADNVAKSKVRIAKARSSSLAKEVRDAINGNA